MTSDLPHLKVRSSKMSVRSGAVTCCDLYESKKEGKQCNEAGGKTALPGVYVNYPFLMRFSNISRGGFFLPAKSLSAPPVAAFALDPCRPCKFVRRDALGTTQPSLLTLWRLHATTTTAKTCKSHRQKLLQKMAIYSYHIVTINYHSLPPAFTNYLSFGNDGTRWM